MVKNISIIGILFLFVTLSGCVKDGVEECPAGTVQLHFFVEKFRNKSLNPLDDREAKFCDRVGHIRYYLYKDGTLIRNQIVDQFQDVGSNCYSLSLPDLEYGDYEMVLVANCTKRALSGDPVKSSNLLLTYPGSSDTEDFFTAVFPFTVNSNEAKEYEVGLLRTHGVVRYTFVNMPSDVSDFEVVMENVGNEKWITGDYQKTGTALQRYRISTDDITRATNPDYVIGTFPSLPDSRSAFHLNLYREGETVPYLTHMVSDTLTVRRNQLLDITTIFNNGNISFVINLDSEWDGSISGGGTEIQ